MARKIRTEACAEVQSLEDRLQTATDNISRLTKNARQFEDFHLAEVQGVVEQQQTEVEISETLRKEVISLRTQLESSQRAYESPPRTEPSFPPQLLEGIMSLREAHGQSSVQRYRLSQCHRSLFPLIWERVAD
jgi:predicted  nucleic acid-binding Zn-ribbon protein